MTSEVSTLALDMVPMKFGKRCYDVECPMHWDIIVAKSDCDVFQAYVALATMEGEN